MPKSTRHQMKRELKRAIGNLEWAVRHMDAVYSTYESDHPQYAESAAAIIATLILAMDSIAALEREI